MPRWEAVVDMEPFHKAFQASGLSKAEIARRVGCDEARVRRMFGAYRYLYRDGKRYGPYKQTHVTHDVAERLADALGLDPFEVGI
jgi:NADH/NAD ratio-sensing transcriptional regulator Rex